MGTGMACFGGSLVYFRKQLPSSTASGSFGVFGMFASQGLVQNADCWALNRATIATNYPSSSYSDTTSSPKWHVLPQFNLCLPVAFSLWRRIWILWDIEYEHVTMGKRIIEPQHINHLGVWTGILGLTSCSLLTSALAPSAITKIKN
jgi:hypothetical protein